MNEDKLYSAQTVTNDKIIVEEMLHNSNSGQWYEWNLFVTRLVNSRTHNIPIDQRDDIVQEAMLRIDKYLPAFRFNCSLRTWIFNIVRSCIIDTYRKSRRLVEFHALIDPCNDVEIEDELLIAGMSATVEDECITRDELRRAMIALQEYVSLHANPTRNRAILEMVLYEDRSLEETAQAVGCSAPVVGYVVRTARRYVREKLGYS
jgi:RNA polymerase sigma factor (sigma-70 family)